MEPDSSPERLSFQRQRLPGSFHQRVVRIEPECCLPYVREDWEDALVVVEQGIVEVECARGGRRTFSAGAVVFMVGLDLVLMRNRGSQAVVLSAVWRAAPP